MLSLKEIGLKYPTNKNDYGFLDIYEKYFQSLRDQKLNILEIGVDKGDSLRLWREYFINSNICGLDINKKDFVIQNVEIYQGDQNDKILLNKIANKYGKFDIIIDDGSHVSKHIINSFNYLFDHLSQNGIYIIEDLQTSYIPRYGGSRINLIKKNSSMNFFKSLSDSINYENFDRPFFKKNRFDGLIKSIHFYQNIVFVFKGKSMKYFHANVKTNFLDKLKKLFSFFFR